MIANVPFVARLEFDDKRRIISASSKLEGESHTASFSTIEESGSAVIFFQILHEPTLRGSICFLPPKPIVEKPRLDRAVVLLTNQRGGMARICPSLETLTSRYDCVLGANLHPNVPTDRHIFVKRIRAWMRADFQMVPLPALDLSSLVDFHPGPPARWRFVVSDIHGRKAEFQLIADMLDGLNTTVMQFQRLMDGSELAHQTLGVVDVRLTVRVDIEDRNFHWETKHNAGADYHFAAHCSPLLDRIGFEFAPALDRQLRVFTNSGQYHHEAEWSHNIPHPVEQSRAHEGCGDAYSPGWFELPLLQGQCVSLVFTADKSDPLNETLTHFKTAREDSNQACFERAGIETEDIFGRQLVLSIQSYIARRGTGKTVIAGFPWFLDWGRDSLIAARGLLAAGMVEEVIDLIKVFGRFEERGTLPNVIYGENASNRETSDAPLWFGILCEEATALVGTNLYGMTVDELAHRSIGDILHEIGTSYLQGTPNGVHMDEDSGLIWSPSHFTWMDTNYPACTPREGYPIEIQILWIRFLRQLNRLDIKSPKKNWSCIADQAEDSIHRLYWIEERGFFADVLLAPRGHTAKTAVVDTALRSNYLFGISFDILSGLKARRGVETALQYLVVPGALRSLAPLPVLPPLPIYGAFGSLLNDPFRPYWGRYEGDEDTRRKLAYHNGTAWTWTFPVFCEALAKAWNFETEATAAARSYLGSTSSLLSDGCLGHLPEIVDGDYPHQQRGCDAQAWSATETLRVWKLLKAHLSPA